MSVQFLPPVAYPTEAGTDARDPYGITVSDLNGDGALDLVATNYFDGSISVLMNQGDGTFGPQTAYSAGTYPQSTAAADMNGDGFPDLLVANRFYSQTVSLFLNQGDGSFAPATTLTTIGDPASVIASDVNGDGRLDLVTASTNNTVQIRLNLGGGSFGGIASFPVGRSPSQVAAGDLDGDGDMDLATANFYGNDYSGSNCTVSVLLNTGSGTFAPQVSYAAGTYPVGLTLADVNLDGSLDIGVIDNYGVVSIYLNDGDGSFGPRTAYSVSTIGFSIDSGDVNGDGAPDLIVSTGAVVILYNNGAGLFAETQTLPTGGFAGHPTAADLNGDGKADIAVAVSPFKAVVLLQEANTPPTATDDSVTVPEDAASTIAGSLLLANDTDPDPGDTKTIVSVDASSAGGANVALNGSGDVVYDPGSLFQWLGAHALATDSFTYTMQDSAGATSAATVEVTIEGANDGPTAVADAWSTVIDEDTTAVIGTTTILGNDTDPDLGDTRTLVSVQTLSAKGSTVHIDAVSGDIVYEANSYLFDSLGAGNVTEDSFTYTMQDSEGAASTATITVTVRGAADGPTVHGTQKPDILVGNAANQRFEAGNGDDFVSGGAGIDRILGENDNDSLYGGDGNDVLEGGRGNDLLNGGRHDDVLTGGAGRDVFAFGLESGDDLITDFKPGNDLIRLLDGVAVAPDGIDVGHYAGGPGSALDTRLTLVDGDGGVVGTVIVVNVGAGVDWSQLIA